MVALGILWLLLTVVAGLGVVVVSRLSGCIRGAYGSECFPSISFGGPWILFCRTWVTEVYARPLHLSVSSIPLLWIWWFQYRKLTSYLCITQEIAEAKNDLRAKGVSVDWDCNVMWYTTITKTKEPEFFGFLPYSYTYTYNPISQAGSLVGVRSSIPRRSADLRGRSWLSSTFSWVVVLHMYRCGLIRVE